MKVLVYGAGAVGLTYSSALVVSGCDVTIFARSKTAAILRRDGLIRSGGFEPFHIFPDQFRVTEHLTNQDICRYKFDVILLCTKLSDLPTIQEDIVRICELSPATRVVLMQNGWGINQFFSNQIPEELLFNSFIYFGAIRPELNTAHITAVGGVSSIGNIVTKSGDSIIEDLVRRIHSGGIPCDFSSDIGAKIWTKMLYNCTTNPLSFILNVKNGELLNNAYAKYTITSLVNELFQVTKALGYSLAWPTAAAYLDYLFNSLLPLTANHRSSMLQDRVSQRKTEIDFLNGAVVEIAKEFDIPCTINQTICFIVKLIEASYAKNHSPIEEISFLLPQAMMHAARY